MFKDAKISLIIPVLNEEENIGTVFSGTPTFIDEIIIVDNGSIDKTTEVCRNLGARIIYEKHRGYGSALKTGLLAAKGDIVICIDGDNTYPLLKIENFLKDIVDNKYDFISGQRVFYNDNNTTYLINKVSNIFISWLIRKFFKIGLNDSQSGMWVFRREILSKIMPFNYGMGFSQEIKLRAWLTPSIKCNEIQISYSKRLGGRTKFKRFQDSLIILGNFLKLFKEYHGFI